jgi:hypothetical protein
VPPSSRLQQGRADRALLSRNAPGKQLGDKQITVRLHEPKKFRAEKLAEQRAKALVGSGASSRGAMSPMTQYGDLPDVGSYGDPYGYDHRQGSVSGHMQMTVRSLAAEALLVRDD